MTKDRNPLLIQNIDILRNSFKFAMHKYKFNIVASIILKDHLHIIIHPENQGNLPQIIRVIKFNFSKNIPMTQLGNVKLSDSAIKRGEKGIWQRRYYDNIIRNEIDMQKHLDYIHYNPTKHYGISPNDWKFSSFEKFVKLGFYDMDWCNFNNINKIDTLDYE